MANKFTTFRKINKNRFRKIYPINHVPAVEGFTSDRGMVVETKLLDVENSEDVVAVLDGSYRSLPAVVASTMSLNSSEFSNVNCFVSSISLNAGIVTLSVGFSATFTGKLALQVLEIN